MQDAPLSRPRYFWWAAALIVLVGLGLRIWHLGDASLWDDESLTKLRAETPLSEFVDSMQTYDNSQVPLYYLLLHLFPTDTRFWLRLPSAIAGTVGIALLMFVTIRLYRHSVLALMAGTILALNPYHIWLSRAARPYALFFDVALLAAYFFLMLLRGDRSRENWAGFVISSMAAYLTHYFAAVLPVSQYILFAFILRRQRRFFRFWIVAQVVAAIPTLVWIIVLLQQHIAKPDIWPKPRPVPADLLLTVWNLTIGYGDQISWYGVLGIAVVLAGLLPGLYYAFRERKTNQVNFYWLWLLIVPLLLVFVVSQFMTRPIYLDRYFMALLPALILLIANGWLRMPGRIGLIALAVVAVIEMGTVLVTFRDGSDERQAWCDSADFVMHNYGSEDGMVISSQVSLLSFSNCLDDLDVLDRTILFDVPGAGPDGIPAKGQWESPVTRLWAVYSDPSETLHNEGIIRNQDPFGSGPQSPLADWLVRRRDQIISRRDFNGVTVFLVDVTNDVYNTTEFGE